MYRANMVTSKSNLYETDWLLSSLLSNLSPAIEHAGRALFLGIRERGEGRGERGEGRGERGEGRGERGEGREERGERREERGERREERGERREERKESVLILILILIRACTHSVRAYA